ncbi:MAG: adenine deaminase [Clostridia bacterium]|nr:adenine deaminase [Clostridia bacterium]
MKNPFCRVPLYEAGATLSAVAQGEKPAELVIRNARLVNVCTGEIQYPIDVASAMGRIAYVGGDASHCVGRETRVVDAGGKYLTPGLLDGHIHIESSMMTVAPFAAAVLPHGTTGVYFDPHEIGNVLGMEGVELMLAESEGTPLKAMLTMPSCVPAVAGFEDSGANLDAADVAKVMEDPRCVALGEMMNYPGILSGAEGPCSIVNAALKAGKTVTGHYSVPETDRGLNAYIAAGVRNCHESARAEDALAKMRLGMYAMLRQGSGWRDLHEVAKAVTQHKVDSRFALLVTDDAHPHTLVEEGHVDRLLRAAVKEGIDPVRAVQMVTLNCAQCFRMDHELGSVTPGKCADLVLFEDLRDFKVAMTVIDGAIVAEDGKLTAILGRMDYPERAKRSMHLGRAVTEDDFAVPAPGEGSVRTRCIEVIPASAMTREAVVTLMPRGGRVEADCAQDVLKAAVFERHRGTGHHALGFVKGFGVTGGAMASTVAHDAHNLLVVGSNDEDMALAANTLAECQGGMCVVKDGRVLGLVPLPVAGLMAEEEASEMAEKVAALGKSWEEIGCTLPAPFMTMALVSLACIPELRLTDKGLVDCRTFTFTELFAE